MSIMGQYLPKSNVCVTSVQLLITDSSRTSREVRSGPKPDQVHRNKEYRYSITSSASASILAGTMRPSAFAVFRLMKREKLVGCNIGNSAVTVGDIRTVTYQSTCLDELPRGKERGNSIARRQSYELI